MGVGGRSDRSIAPVDRPLNQKERRNNMPRGDGTGPQGQDLTDDRPVSNINSAGGGGCRRKGGTGRRQGGRGGCGGGQGRGMGGGGRSGTGVQGGNGGQGSGQRRLP